MKTIVIALALVLVAAVPAGAAPIDYTLDWHSVGQTLFSTFDRTGVSPATLNAVGTDTSGTLFHPDGPAFDLRFTSGGRTYGGLVGEGSFQVADFEIPGTGTFDPVSGFGSGTFHLAANGRITGDLFVGTGHTNGQFTFTGTPRSSVSAFEPGTLGLGIAGLVGAMAARRRRRASRG